MNRIEIRDHYRICAGLLCLINTILVMAAACLAIYVAEFDEMQASEGNGIIALNGLYTIFVVGIIFSVCCLIAGIVAVKSQSEGVFSFARFISAVITVLMAFSVIDSIYVMRNPEMVWTSERKGIVGIIFGVSLLAAVIAIAVVVLCSHGLKYYDRGKKLAKDAPDFGNKKPVYIQAGVSLLCVAVLNTSLALLSLYFSNMIKYFDRTMVEQNHGFSAFYFILFIIGILVMIDTVFVSVLDFLGKQMRPKFIHTAAIIENVAYILIFVVSGIVAMGQKFVKSDCPDVAYIIFAYILAVFALGYLGTNFMRIRRGDA